MRSKLFLCVEFDPTATSVAAVCRSSSLTLISKQKQEHFYFHQLLVCVLIIRVTRARGSCITVSSEWEKPHSDFKSTFEKTFSVHESNLSISVPPIQECFNSPYGTSFFSSYAEKIPGESTQMLSEAAKENEIYLVGGRTLRACAASGHGYWPYLCI